MEDFIIIAVLAIIIGLAVFYVYKAKKNGKKCIGCPSECSCNKNKGNCCCCQNGNLQK